MLITPKKKKFQESSNENNNFDNLSSYIKLFEKSDFSKLVDPNCIEDSNDSGISKKEFKISINETKKINEYCCKKNVKIESYFYSILSLIVSSLSRNEKVMLGVKHEHGFEDSQNIMPISLDLTDIKVFDTLLTQVNKIVLFNKIPSNITFETFSKSLIDAGWPHNEIFQIIASYFDSHAPIKNIESSSIKNFEIYFSFLNGEKHLSLFTFYKKSHFTASFIERIYSLLSSLISKTFSDMPLSLEQTFLLSEKEDRLIKKLTFNHVLKEFELKKDMFPNRICARGSTIELTYKDVDSISDKISAYIRKSGLLLNRRINLLIDRSPYFIPAIIGIWKANCSVVPVDIRLHPKRIAEIVTHSKAELTLDATKGERELGVEIKKINLMQIINDPPTEKNKISYNLYDEAYLIFTSGTTGFPKGVSVTHNNIAHYSFSILDKIKIEKNKCYNFGVVSSLSADLGNTCIYPALIHGSTINLFSYEESIDQILFAEKIKEYKIDILKIVPSHFFGLFNPNEIDLLSVPSKIIIFGGEKLLKKNLSTLINKLPHLSIFNHYGPTETTVGVFLYDFSKFSKCFPKKHAPIGFPLGDTQYYIVDKRNRVLPSSFLGELVVFGSNVSSGYINDNKNEAFINLEGNRCYKTGDIVSVGKNDEVYFEYREDSQHKINGIRVDLSELDAALKKVSTCTDYHIDIFDNKIYVFLYGSINFNPINLIEQLKNEVANYLLPAQIIAIEKLPITLNGKIDKIKLKQLSLSNELPDMQLLSDLPKNLLDMWRKYIGEIHSLEATIFQLGANSLQATKFLYEVQKNYGLRISLGAFLANPTLNYISGLISNNSTSLEAQNFQELKHIQKDFSKLTGFQRRMWVINQIFPTDSSYNIIITLQLGEHLNSNSIKPAFKCLFEKFSLLRAKFTVKDDLPIQHFNQEFENIWFDVSEEEFELNCKKYDIHGYSLLNNPPFKVFFHERKLLIFLHHIITDRLSNDLLLRALDNILSDNKLLFSSLESHPPLVHELEPSPESLTTYQDFWKSELVNVNSISWPYHTQAAYTGGSIRIELDEEESLLLKKLARKNNVSLNILFFSISNLAVSYVCNIKTFFSLTAFSRRLTEKDFISFGPAIDTLALKVNIDPNVSFNEFLRNLFKLYLKNMERSSVDFGIVSKWCNLYNQDGQSIINYMYNYEEYIKKYDNFTRIDNKKRVAKFDLTVTVEEKNLSFDINIEACEKIGTECLNSIVDSIKNIIKSICKNDCIVLEDINFRGGKKTFPELPAIKSEFVNEFKKIAFNYPQNPCIIEDNNVYTYNDIDKLSNQISYSLIDTGINASPIAVLLPRGKKFLATVLGIMKSNNFYVPLDISSPKARINNVLQAADCKLTIDENKYQSLTNNSCAEFILDIPTNTYKYMIFTSGSTGTPKGVPINNKSLMNYLTWAKETYDLSPGMRVPLLTSISYDLSITSYLLPLITGAQIVVFDPYNNLLALKECTEYDKDIDLLKLTPTHLHILKSQYPSYVIKARKLIVGGEQLYYEHLENVSDITTIYNEYGPTETTVGCICKEFTSDKMNHGKVAIGAPIKGTICKIVGIYNQEVVNGAKGNLYIGGAGVFDGYYKTDSQCFDYIKYYHPLMKFYNTNDIAMYYNSEFVFFGRTDKQIKIEGNRVNIEEIETSLDKLGIFKSSQVFYENINSEKKLIAVVKMKEKIVVPPNLIKQKLLDLLPSYMVPDYIIKEDELLIKDSGKINWSETLCKMNSFNNINPSKESNKIINIKKIWEQVLHREVEDENKNFFDIGGDSIKILHLSRLLRESFNVEIRLVDLFRYTTINQQAALLEKETIEDQTISHTVKKRVNSLIKLRNKSRG